MIITKEKAQARTTIMVRGLEKSRVLSWLALGGPLAVSAVLNLWNLAQNGYSNLYYSVAVQSMIQSWHNFFFNSYDAGGFITVDKPPVALWVQAISARLFGFNPLAILLPEALAGIASVALLFFLVKRIFGTFAAFVAALALALTPIAVAVERTNNTDTMLMFTLLLAAWAITLATERGLFKFLALSMALVGVAFNVKMLAAFIVLPTFYLVYLVTAPIKWPRRIMHLALGSIIVFGVALSWPLAVDLTPPSQRPWVGGSQSNSVIELALGYNGLGRVTGNEGASGRPNFGGIAGLPPIGAQPNRRGGFANPRNPGNPGNPGRNPIPPTGIGGRFAGGAGGVGGPGGGMFGAGQPGAARLFTGEMAGQWSWLFPLAAFGLVAAGLLVRRRWPLEPTDKRRLQTLLLWGGWLATYGVVFSIASGIFHPYYLIMVAPATAALVGAGLSSLWKLYRRGGWQAWLLPVALLATALWQAKVLSVYPAWSTWLTPILLGGSVLGAGALVVSSLVDRLPNLRLARRLSPGFVGAALVALLITPTAWSITPVLAGPSNASLPVAGPEALNQNDPSSWTRMNNTSNSGLVQYLEANQDGYFYLIAVANSQQASSIALSTGKPVLSAGGFMGSDPALTIEKLTELVATKRVRFVMGLGGVSLSMGLLPGFFGSASTPVSNFLRTYCKEVDPTLYGGSSIAGFTGAFGLGNNSPLYDCAPNP